jgi:plasmid stabilization system protein ParE
MTSNASVTTSRQVVPVLPRRLQRRSIVQPVADLETFPQSGRHGRVEGTRELTFASLPFVAIYEVHPEEVHILRVLHGARQWPPG